MKLFRGFKSPIYCASQYPPLRLTQTGGTVSSEHMQTPLHYISFIPRQSDPALYSTPVVDCLSSSGYRDIIPRGNYSVYHFYQTETETDAT